MKRIFRQATETARQRMSAAHKGKTLPFATKQKISQSMVEYWKTIPNKPTDDEDNNEIKDGLDNQ